MLFGIIISIVNSHPILYIRYCFEKITNTNDKYFSFAKSDIDNGIIRENENDFKYYIPNKYFSNNPHSKTTPFDVTDFDAKYGYICVDGFLYNSFEKVELYINNKKIIENVDSTYNSIFDNNYIVKTIRAFVYKNDLLLNQQNKITYTVGNNLYDYYFYVVCE